MSFNFALNPHFMNVPHVNIVSVPCVTKPLAKCSIYIVVTVMAWIRQHKSRVHRLVSAMLPCLSVATV
jgi:Na+/H+ antiporter NhaA